MKIIGTILSWISTLILIISTFTLILILNISTFFNIDAMQKNIDNIDFTHEINKIQNSSATSENKAEIADIIDTAYKEAEKHGISSKLVDEIINSSEVKQFLGKALGSTTDYIINGKTSKAITSEEFNKLLDDNIDKWVKQSNIEISDSKKEVLVVRIKSASAGIIDNLPTYRLVETEETSNIIKVVQLIFSTQVKIGLLMISLISLLIIIIAKRKHRIWLTYVSTAALIIGLLTLGTSFVISDAITFILTEYNLTFMLSTLVDNLAHNILISAVITIVISLITFILYKIKSKTE